MQNAQCEELLGAIEADVEAFRKKPMHELKLGEVTHFAVNLGIMANALKKACEVERVVQQALSQQNRFAGRVQDPSVMTDDPVLIGPLAEEQNQG